MIYHWLQFNKGGRFSVRNHIYVRICNDSGGVKMPVFLGSRKKSPDSLKSEALFDKEGCGGGGYASLPWVHANLFGISAA